ncbi:flagellar hook-basal body complex protein FliE [Tabrizicola oligotrophica]|uniref:Flagellar hook-basal body complex protein FliE n=1 Tax=Tabrizicola oligotrophica TaxID=2710650 RepID=A0A6M0QUG5_9RHOB|nr:flagellar hook-basal body complex protein FliE [Tabrizicola oligotrophica]NEY91138.1 flagellar hook-basal body complex protein FliE [Tabrizicola oligotrophica]
MDVRTSLATQSYAQARSAAAPKPGAAEAGFARLAGSFAETLAQGEQTARAAMTGGADPHALVQALASSQLAVETVATVRDKVVEAYQEILRMPI